MDVLGFVLIGTVTGIGGGLIASPSVSARSTMVKANINSITEKWNTLLH